MVADPRRWSAVQAALEHVVRPGSTVLDLGAGYGSATFEAVARGASRVIAVEPAEAILVGERVARANGLSDRIAFHRARLEDVPPEPVDVVFADLRGGLPFMPGHFEALALARRAWLRPGGVLVPHRDELFVAPVRDERLAQEKLTPWGAAHPQVDLAAARALLANEMHRVNPPVTCLAAPPRAWAEIDYGQPEIRSYGKPVRFDGLEAGPVHGLVVWFDGELVPGIRVSNAPDGKDTVYGRFLIAFDGPLDLPAGGTLEVDMRVSPVRGQWIWRWVAEVREAQGASVGRRDGSSWNAQTVDAGRLARRRPDARPALGDDARLLAVVLAAIDGNRTVAEIAAEAREKLPSLLPDEDTAMEKVGDIVERHGR